MFNKLVHSLSQWPSGLRRTCAAARLLGLRTRIPPGAWMSVCSECCVLSGRVLCVGADHSSRGVLPTVVCLVCDLKTSKMKRPCPHWAVAQETDKEEGRDREKRLIIHLWPYSLVFLLTMRSVNSKVAFTANKRWMTLECKISRTHYYVRIPNQSTSFDVSFLEVHKMTAQRDTVLVSLSPATA